MFNFHQYRLIEAPGWTLGWTWAEKEAIWNMMGAQTREQGDCSKLKGLLPHCCKRDPEVVDLLPGTPYSQQTANCCKGGVISSWGQDPQAAISSFQVTVGSTGTTKTTVRLPKKFTLKAPGPGYTCGSAKVVKPTRFPTNDGRRATQAMITWDVICTYSQFRAQETPTCCVSLSAFYSETIVPCPTCTCGCQKNGTRCGNCVECIGGNYTQGNLVVQHPNFDNLVQLSSFNYRPLPTYGTTNDSAMLWGQKFYNELPMQAGPSGNIQSELLFGKDLLTFSFENGWAFPHRALFNGDSCVKPQPDSYPYLPNAGNTKKGSWLMLVVLLSTGFLFIVLLFRHVVVGRFSS
ncbi:COBRA-like protein 3 [Capsicum baccatum]|uniref:COBRA-like protein 3 n=1 Tax=Capsicum baccatum TaxID=33114 RepID=A0A2G2VEN8_CAPBA|nr:COBRA-like protein 3 [Capsicum baccatum]